MTEKASISLESSVVASPKQVSCEMADEVVILSLRTGEYYGLNPVAATMWNLLQQRRTVSELRDALLDEYSGVTQEQCAREVLEVLAEMVDLELVEFL